MAKCAFSLLLAGFTFGLKKQGKKCSSPTTSGKCFSKEEQTKEKGSARKPQCLQHLVFITLPFFVYMFSTCIFYSSFAFIVFFAFLLALSLI